MKSRVFAAIGPLATDLKIVVISAVLLSGSANAVLIDSSTPIPDENILLNFNGLDWVYAGPFAPNEFSLGIETPDYRAAEGWRYATASEWAVKPDWTDFIIGGAAVSPVAAFQDHSSYRFASEYWSDVTSVDLIDAAEGRITNGLDIGSLSSAWETWYVRDSSVVPIPATVWLFGSGLLGLVGVARKNSRVSDGS